MINLELIESFSVHIVNFTTWFRSKNVKMVHLEMNNKIE